MYKFRLASLFALTALAASGLSQTVKSSFNRTTSYNPGAAWTQLPCCAANGAGQFVVAGTDSIGLGFVAIHNRGGGLLGKVDLFSAGTYLNTPRDVYFDSSGDIFVGGGGSKAGEGSEIVVAKVGESFVVPGTYELKWLGAAHYTAGLNDDYVHGVLGPDGRFYAAGAHQVTGFDYDPCAYCIDGTGAAVYAEPRTETGTYETYNTVAANASGMAVFCGAQSLVGVARVLQANGSPAGDLSFGSDFITDFAGAAPGAASWTLLGNAGGTIKLVTTDLNMTASTALPLGSGTAAQLVSKGGFFYALSSNLGLGTVRLAKVTPSMSVVWNIGYFYPAMQSCLAKALYVDNWGEPYVLAEGTPSANALTKYVTMKFNPSNGALRWAQASLPYAGISNRPSSIVVHEPSGDVFSVGMKTDFEAEGQVGISGFQQAAIASPDVFRPKKNTTFNSPVTLTFNDRYVLGSTIHQGALPSHGTVTIHANKTFTYVPDNNFVGTDTFTYTLTKTGLNTTTATVTLIVGN